MSNQDDTKLSELQFKAEEMALKRYDAENKAYEMWNSYLRDTRSRVDGLIRAVLLVAGGALTLSVGAFLRGDHPLLTLDQLCTLKWAWGLLTLSMVGVLSVALISLASSDLHGKRWGIWLKNKQRGELKQPKIAPWAAWGVGLLAFGCLIVGLELLARVAVNGVV